jgi:hypothetical protein
VLFARSKLESLALDPSPLSPRMEGTEEGFHWQTTVTNVPGNALWARQSLQDVQLTVTWRAGLVDRSLTVATRHLGKVAP